VATFEKNSDGSTIVKLAEPIKLGGDELTRVTIPKLRGKHLIGAPVLDSMGQYLVIAARVVEPKGALEEMTPADAVAIGNHIIELIQGKATAGQEKTGQDGSP
jgi:hypothetical protein